MKNVGCATLALAVLLWGGVALATPLYQATISGPSDVSWDASSGEFSLGADVDNLAFWWGDQEIGNRELRFNFLADVEVSLGFLFATADSEFYDVASITFDSDDSFSESFAGTSWWDMTVEEFAFERSFTAGAGDTLSITLSTAWDEVYESGVVGTIDITPTAPAPAPVPEPATMLLFGTGLAGLVGLRRRKTKK